MKFILSPDSFKGSLTAQQAAAAMEAGIRVVIPDAKICTLPIADGGEGTMGVLQQALGGKIIACKVPGPYGDPVQANYLMVGGMAVVELAQASGLTLSDVRDPIHASTYGTGLLLRHALEQGAQTLCLTLGGSATNDGGAGIAKALGIRLLDSAGREVEPTCAGLAEVVRIDTADLVPQVRHCSWRIACDVTNPLCGPEGASAIYGPQKGADAAMVAEMDAILERYGSLLEAQSGVALKEMPGSGAAGGAALPLLAFAGAEICSGIDMVLDAVGFDAAAEGAAWVLTGEGSIDGQTRFGKAIAGIAKRAAAKGIPVGVFAGKLGIAQADCPAGMFLREINPPSRELAYNLAHAAEHLQQAVTAFLQEEAVCPQF